jgi:peptidoglycan/xylan/chitin deacetylase (PgdA/CDA1 family)
VTGGRSDEICGKRGSITWPPGRVARFFRVFRWARPPHSIVLLPVGSIPDGSTLAADALPRVIDRLRALGYRLVRLTWVLDEAP